MAGTPDTIEIKFADEDRERIDKLILIAKKAEYAAPSIKRFIDKMVTRLETSRTQPINMETGFK